MTGRRRIVLLSVVVATLVSCRDDVCRDDHTALSAQISSMRAYIERLRQNQMAYTSEVSIRLDHHIGSGVVAKRHCLAMGIACD